MPTAENDKPKTADEGDAEDKLDSGTAAAPAGLPVWAQNALETLKKYQNVVYAALTVLLLVWAVVRFRAAQREKDETQAAWELSQAETVDALKALADKYPNLAVTPVIHFTLANRLHDEKRVDEAIAEYEKTNREWPDSFAGKLAGQRVKTAKENKAFEPELKRKLDLLKEQGGEDKPADTGKATIDASALPLVAIETRRGRIVLELDEEGAPNVVANFIRLVETGYYENTPVLKAEKDLSVTLGDPMKDGSSPRTFTIDFESSKLPAKAGVVAMLRDLPPEGQPDSDALKNTASTRFVILTGDAPALEGKYLVFGRVTEGLEAARQLTAEDTIAAKVTRKRKEVYEPKRTAK